MQPFVVYVESTNKSFVMVDDCLYACETLLKAIDGVFKFCNSYQIEYNFECAHIWEFVQIYIYEIKTKYDQHNKNALALISSLKGLQVQH